MIGEVFHHVLPNGPYLDPITVQLRWKQQTVGYPSVATDLVFKIPIDFSQGPTKEIVSNRNSFSSPNLLSNIYGGHYVVHSRNHFQTILQTSRDGEVKPDLIIKLNEVNSLVRWLPGCPARSDISFWMYYNLASSTFNSKSCALPCSPTFLQALSQIAPEIERLLGVELSNAPPEPSAQVYKTPPQKLVDCSTPEGQVRLETTQEVYLIDPQTREVQKLAL